tara:strand:- start:352 stop:663 length:312 start_codon:yes stop_codon:yes gene_type:complete
MASWKSIIGIGALATTLVGSCVDMYQSEIQGFAKKDVDGVEVRVIFEESPVLGINTYKICSNPEGSDCIRPTRHMIKRAYRNWQESWQDFNGISGRLEERLDK